MLVKIMDCKRNSYLSNFAPLPFMSINLPTVEMILLQTGGGE